MTRLTPPPSSQRVHVGEVQRALLALVSSLIALLSAATVVWADMSIRLGRWPILPGTIAVILGLYLAFAALSFPVLPRPSVRAMGERLGYVIVPTIGAAIPAVVTGISLAQSITILRAGLVVAAMFIGLGVRLRCSSPPWRGEVPLWLRVLDTARQSVLLMIVALAMLLYVSGPNLVVTSP